MSASTGVVQQLVGRLKSKHEEVRAKAARELSLYVKTELREATQDEITAFMDEFNHHIFEMVSGSDINEKKGGILAIVCLIGADVGKINTRTIRFANYLRNLLPSNDVGVMELAARTVGKLALVSGTCTAEYVEFEVKKAFEWLSGDRHENKRHAAVLVLKELASTMPTYFYQQVSQFFELVFQAVRDPKPVIREQAVEALRAALVVTAQRESVQPAGGPAAATEAALDVRPKQCHWYRLCYDEVLAGLEEPAAREKAGSREERAHGSLLVLNELLRCSNLQWERRYEELMERLSCPGAPELDPLALAPPRFRGAGPHHGRQQQQPAPRRPLLHESAACRALMLERLDEVVDEALAQRHSRSPHIQQALMQLLPRLAAFRRQSFVAEHLREMVAYLLGALRGRERERAQAFVCLGLTTLAVGEEAARPFLPRLWELIRAGLPQRETPSKKRAQPLEPALFACVGLLGHACGQEAARELRELLEPMLATGLSPVLTTCLRELAATVPSLRPDVSQGLLRMLSQMLMYKPLRHPGAPWTAAASPQTSGPGPGVYHAHQHAPGPEADVAATVLGLRTLGTFDFDGSPLLQFVRRCADYFLDWDEPEVRLEAVKTCSRLLRLASVGQSGPTVTATVSSVLGKLLVVGITDQEPEVRYWVLASLDEPFDIHLAQAESLSCLFVAMNDEVFEIRELAIRTIGRLSGMNPAYVMPALRKTLIQLLTELEHSGMGRNKEQATRMLDHLVCSAPRLIRPYMEPVLKVLVPKLREPEPNPGVVLAVLRALGDLAEVSGQEMQPWMPELLSILLEMLVDASSPEKRALALWLLGQLVSSTGHVVRPYTQYPSLLDVLMNFLKTEQQSVVRRETIRVLGLLGALDPYKHKMNLGQIASPQYENVSSRPSADGLGAGLVAAGGTATALGNAGPVGVGGAHPGDELSTSEMLVNMPSATLEEYYPAIAIATLMRIIREPTLAQHHTMVVQAVSFIFKSLGIKCVPYIAQVMPSFLNVLRSADVSFREYLFQQLAILIAIVKQHIRNYLDDIFALVQEFWTCNSPLQVTLILLVEHIAVALGSEFKIYLPRLMPQILRVLCHDASKERQVTLKLLLALQKFGSNLDSYLHLILPPVVRLFQCQDPGQSAAGGQEVPIAVARSALETVEQLAEVLDFSDFSSRIVQPLLRCLEQCPDLRGPACDTLCALLLQLGPKFQVFLPLVQRVMTRQRIVHQRFDALVDKMQSEARLGGGVGFELGSENAEPPRSSGMTPAGLASRRQRQARMQSQRAELGLASHSSDATVIKKLNVSASNLQKAWTATRRVSKDDWLEWLRSLSIGLLKESPSPALRSCWALAQTYSQLPRDLFNAAFVSCWSELDETHRAELISTLQQALTVPDLPEISQTILNIAEFMEHCDKGPLPLDIRILGERAMHCRAYAKALHYKEDEFHKNRSSAVFESLISINNKLQQKEAAEGLLEYVMNQQQQQQQENKGNQQEGKQELKVQVRWYEKLHNWDKALHLYRERLEVDAQDVESTLGEMRCLEALGEWGQLHEVAMTQWASHSQETKQRMARMAAAAAWGLNQWESMQRYVALIPEDSQDGAFYRAVLAIHDEQYDLAHRLIDNARDLLDTELTAMVGESYQRAYNAMVEVQKLAELEEVIQYKLVPERRATIKSMWWERLQGGQRIVEDWQKIIQVHTLVISPQDDMYTWLKYASLCRKSGNLQLCHKTLVMLLGADPSQRPEQPVPTQHPQVTFAYCKHMWVADKREEAYGQLQRFVQNFFPNQQQNPVQVEDERQSEVRQRLLARCNLKLGEWLEALHGIDEKSIPAVLLYYAAATKHDPSWYKAWHAFAYTNFEAVLFYKHQQQAEANAAAVAAANSVESPTVAMPAQSHAFASQYISRFTVPALEGFIRSINLSHGNSLQDTLRLLTLWFEYGQWPEVYEAIIEGIRLIEINTWLQVIPQLIARIDTPRALVGRCIHNLLVDIGKSHPQALVYPLTVASKSASPARKTAANKILNSMSEHSPTLVQQAKMVSDELIRVAILWHELWHEGLEEASRLYFGERNVKGMFDTLEPLHAMLERGPQTLKETSFNQAYGRDLMEAQDWCHRYKVSGNVRDLNQAWDLYYHVFRRISRQLPQLTSLELQYVSPKLLLCRDLELAVPGSYQPGQPIVKIGSIHSSMQVITSKQRPRKLCIKGSNGKDYMFLLKGHEDLRQDERVMQLFGLVNTLLLHDPDTFRRNLTIQRYAVIPLSTNSGLIGWVPHCDTLHTLIRDYREKKKILLNIEHRIMLRMAPDYDHLMLMQKVEVFEHALEHTHGDDLARLLWLKSPSSEVWFDRRTNYTRSLAVMSMVGYILGLGDRHPSNLMLDRLTGKILHIDFGDCFEVAMTREKFPEKIPFRLTRMLINAMEVTGIEGTYRCTCESVMSVLHRNKDSLMAVLEAFVYDPLLNWRLMDNAQPKSKRSEAQGISSGSSQEHADMLDSLTATLPKKGVPCNIDNGGESSQPEALNKKALQIINRVRDKLTGRDFSHEETLTVQRQVDLLIRQATNNENLCQCYIGWCPFW
ncbi:serine/threonine-protein kinase mTOR isoform X2 [Phymastichus coffea]|uniref:serine/threonine-protein kinase mTOR isoform X2 n=1 Tax=Phymastichus coffea TaxID=108790 RepID=UPI00273CDBAB|nr:serine/threonine-protein kinase mTOR isoform X2 [Phymastichus coffea]